MKTQWKVYFTMLIAKLWSTHCKNGFLPAIVYKLVLSFPWNLLQVFSSWFVQPRKEDDLSDGDKNSNIYLKVVNFQTYEIIKHKTSWKSCKRNFMLELYVVLRQ